MNAFYFITNWAKVGAIRLADLVTWLFDPFEEFTRPAQPKYDQSLEDKAEAFERDMVHSWVDGIAQYNIPVNSGDQALWHGIYTAMSAIRYSVNKDTASLRLLSDCIEGLLRHQRVGYEASPRLVRGYREDGSFEDEVSNDQASGHLAGIYFMWKYGDIACREAARVLINGLASELVHNDYHLVNVDGSPTKHGKLINGYLTDPLNLTLCLAILKAAEAIDKSYALIWRMHYENLRDRYAPLIPYAKVKLLWWDERPAGHRAAIHYSILCDLVRDHDEHRRYLLGLIRTWKIERKSANPWIYYLLRRQVLIDPSELEKCVKHLEEFTVEDKRYNAERINSKDAQCISWGGHLRALQPIPRWKAGSQDFFWQRHLYSVDDWEGNGTGTIRHNGLDFLVAYYGLKSLRLI